MKNKSLIFILAAAIITASFTFTSTEFNKNEETKIFKPSSIEPIGGFVLEERL